MYVGLHVKCPLLLSDYNETWTSINILSKNTHISNFVKIHSVRAELFHADVETDRQTDMTKLIAATHNFANARKNRNTCHAPSEILPVFVRSKVLMCHRK